jgi:hypothetical protein
MTCTTMFAFKLQATSHHMPISKMPKHGILNTGIGVEVRLHLKINFFFYCQYFMVFGHRVRVSARKAR